MSTAVFRNLVSIHPLLGSLVGMLSLSAPCLAESQPMGEKHLTINATTDFSDLRAGDSGLLAIDIVVQDQWHTYWPGVSDTGYGISFQIDAPDSIELKDPIWPSPKRYLQPGDILDHTYEATETVLYPFSIKEDAADSVIVFNIDTNFLVCKEICLPGKASTTATLRVVGRESERVETARHDTLRKQFENRPKPFDSTDMAVRLQWIDKAAAVMFRDATRIEFYADSECTTLAHPIQDAAVSGNRLEIRFNESDNKVLSGRVKVNTPTGVEHYDIDEKAPE